MSAPSKPPQKPTLKILAHRANYMVSQPLIFLAPTLYHSSDYAMFYLNACLLPLVFPVTKIINNQVRVCYQALNPSDTGERFLSNYDYTCPL